MKKTLPTFVSFLFCCITGQALAQPSGSDSLSYYLRQLNQLRRDAWDSLEHSPQYTALQDKISEIRKKKRSSRASINSYSGIALFGDIMHSDYTKFNNSIAQDGFSSLNSTGGRFGLGIVSKTERIMIDFYLFAGGFANRSKKGAERIETSLSNVLQFDLGYDLLNSRYISVYPFAGLSLRTSSLRYTKPVELNPAYNNITDIIANEQSVNATSIRAGYQAGIGAETAVRMGKTGERKTIVFAKFGINRPIGRDRYKIHGVRYNPGIRQAEWLLTIGIKFVNFGR